MVTLGCVHVPAVGLDSMSFAFRNLKLDGLVLVEPRRFKDDRGFFMETYKASEISTTGLGEIFVQDNHSRSSRGVLRGMHLQHPPSAQSKLVRVVTGTVWDVAVDLQEGLSDLRAMVRT